MFTKFSILLKSRNVSRVTQKRVAEYRSGFNLSRRFLIVVLRVIDVSVHDVNIIIDLRVLSIYLRGDRRF